MLPTIEECIFNFLNFACHTVAMTRFQCDDDHLNEKDNSYDFCAALQSIKHIWRLGTFNVAVSIIKTFLSFMLMFISTIESSSSNRFSIPHKVSRRFGFECLTMVRPGRIKDCRNTEEAFRWMSKVHQSKCQRQAFGAINCNVLMG